MATSETKLSYDKLQVTGEQQEVTEKTRRRRKRTLRTKLLGKGGIMRMRLRRALRRRTRFLLAWRVALSKALKRLKEDKGRAREHLTANYFIFNMNLASLNCIQVK